MTPRCPTRAPVFWRFSDIGLGLARANSTQHYRRAFVAMGGQAKMWMMNADHHPSLLDAVVRRDATDAERFLKGHIRRLRIEVSDHPAAFGGSP